MRGWFRLVRDGGGTPYFGYGESRILLQDVRVKHHQDGWIPVVQSPHFAYAKQTLAGGRETPDVADEYLMYRTRQFPELGADFHSSTLKRFNNIISEAAAGQSQRQILGTFKNGLFFVTDGFHRCAAAAAAGHAEVYRSRVFRLSLVLGFATYFRHQARKVVLHRALLHFIRPIVARLAQNTTVTCLGKNDGGGAQVHAVLSVAAFCQFFGVTFRHTPLGRISHVRSDGSDLSRDYSPYWEEQLDRFGFVEQSEEAEPLEGPLALLGLILRGKSRNRHFSLLHAHTVTNLIPEAFLSVKPIHQTKVHSTKTSLVCAVHVRRGDVSQSGAEAFRYSSNAEVHAAISYVRRICPNERIKFRIVTQDKVLADDELFQNCTVVGTGDPTEAFDELVSADLLVVAKSSFSYVAGLLSQGHVFCPRFWHPPIPTWTVLPAWSAEPEGQAQDPAT